MIERGLLDVHARPETRKLRADVGIGASEARTVLLNANMTAYSISLIDRGVRSLGT